MPANLDQFTRSLSDCGLMDAKEIQAFLNSLPSDKSPQTAEDFARELYRAGKITKFQAQALYQGKTKGLVMGNYVILDKLGEGGMGQVYKAQHKRMERIVALKMLPPSATKSTDAIKRFLREVKAAARLSHPNVVTAYDADEAQGVHFMVMEHVEGQDLGKVVKERGPLPLNMAVNLLTQVAKGLQYAHEQGVIHRDIKPGNLLLDSHETVKILDLGLARFEGAVGAHDEGLTHSGQVMGTLDYMAPEQALDTKHADARSDIYSLGCTFYFLLTGRSVFPADTITKKIFAHAQQPIPSLRAVRPDVPEAMDLVYQRMLAKNPDQRPQTMAEVLTALQGCLAVVGTQGPPGGVVSSPPPLPHPISRPPISAPPSPTSNLRRADVETSSARFAIPGLSPSEMAQSVMLPRRQTRHQPTRKPWLATLNVAGFDKRLKIGLAVGTGLLFLAVLLAVIISLRTKAGTLIVELSDPDVTVQIVSEEGRVEIERKGDKGKVGIAVDPGKHRLRLTKAGVEVFAQEFTMVSGGREVIKARWEPVVAQADPGKPGGASTGPADGVSRSRSSDATKYGDPGFVSLFDTNTFKGWKFADPAIWSIDQGVVRGQHRAGAIFTEEEFRDFELHADVKINAAGNSGIFFRAVAPPSQARTYEIQIIGSQLRGEGRTGFTGSLWDIAGVSMNWVTDDQWFHIRLVVQGSRIRTEIDGHAVLDYTDALGRYRQGSIGFQCHDPQTDVAFKNVCVKRLDEEKTSATVTAIISPTTGEKTSSPSSIPGHAQASADDPGFVSLFDGKTLGGWHTNGRGHWAVEDGAIVGRMSKGKNAFGHLISDGRYRDFELRGKFRLRGNSGVYVRGLEVPPDGMIGIQVELWSPAHVGGLIELLAHPATVGARVDNPRNGPGSYFKAHDWNEMAIEAMDTQVTVRVNGVQTAQLSGYATRREGNIALQLYGNVDTEVMFKDIRVKTGNRGGVGRPRTGGL